MNINKKDIKLSIFILMLVIAVNIAYTHILIGNIMLFLIIFSMLRDERITNEYIYKLEKGAEKNE